MSEKGQESRPVVQHHGLMQGVGLTLYMFCTSCSTDSPCDWIYHHLSRGHVSSVASQVSSAVCVCISLRIAASVQDYMLSFMHIPVNKGSESIPG